VSYFSKEKKKSTNLTWGR